MKQILLFAWNPEFGISEIVATLTFLAIVIGGVFALLQWKTSLKQKRADYLEVLLEREKSYYKVFLMFEYDTHWYDASFHNGGEIEDAVDGYLLFLNYICYLKNKHLIHKEDFMFFSYDIKRVIQNYQVKDYLHNVYCFSNKIKENFSFSYLLDYAIKNGLIKDSSNFKNPKSKNYSHNLNY